jgi:hypothetical protein
MSMPRSTKEFFKSLNELLKKDFQLKDLGNLPSFFKNLGSASSNHFSSSRSFGSSRLDDFFKQFQPIKIAGLIRNGLVFLSIITIVYTGLIILGIARQDNNTRPAQLYQLEDIQKSYTLFGQKEFELSSVKVTGIMLGNKPSNSFATLEVLGKSTGAIAVGEAFNDSYFLKGIKENQVEIVYQGNSYTITKTDKPLSKE